MALFDPPEAVTPESQLGVKTGQSGSDRRWPVETGQTRPVDQGLRVPESERSLGRLEYCAERSRLMDVFCQEAQFLSEDVT